MGWIITDKATGKAVLETFSQQVAEAVNTDKYKVQTSLEYLREFNRKVREADGITRSE